MTRTSTSRAALWVALIAAAVLAGCSKGPAGPQGETGLTGETGQTLDWSDTIADANLDDSVYAIGLFGPAPWDPEADHLLSSSAPVSALTTTTRSGPTPTWRRPCQSCWTCVTEFFPEFAGLLGPVAIRSGTRAGGDGTYSLDLESVLYHPGYDLELELEEGIVTPDLAVFRIEASLDDVPQLLPRDLVTQLRVGQPIGTLGLPGELDALYGTVPLATFKDGTISALRPYSPDEPAITPENSRMLQHNLDLTGGTSGSAIFDHRGFIVAVNFAGYYRVIIGLDPDGVDIQWYHVPVGPWPGHSRRRGMGHGRPDRRREADVDAVDASRQGLPVRFLPSLPRELERPDARAGVTPREAPGNDGRSDGRRRRP